MPCAQSIAAFLPGLGSLPAIGQSSAERVFGPALLPVELPTERECKPLTAHSVVHRKTHDSTELRELALASLRSRFSRLLDAVTYKGCEGCEGYESQAR
jgi:hypothetical protein